MISTGQAGGGGILMISNEAGDPVNEDKVGATQLWHRLHSRPCVCVCVPRIVALAVPRIAPWMWVRPCPATSLDKELLWSGCSGISRLYAPHRIRFVPSTFWPERRLM